MNAVSALVNAIAQHPVSEIREAKARVLCDAPTANGTPCAGWLSKQKAIAESQGNQLAADIAAGAITYLQDVFSGLSEITTDYAQIERKTRQGQN